MFECLPAEFPSVAVFRDHKRARLYRYGEAPPQATTWEKKSERGFLAVRNFHVLSVLKKDLTGCDLMFVKDVCSRKLVFISPV